MINVAFLSIFGKNYTRMSEQGKVSKSNKGEIGYIEFYHPAHNSLPGNLLADLVTAIEDQSNDDKINLTVINSRGDRTFCAGASFTELSSIENISEGKTFFMGFANVINAIRKSQNLVIMIVQGKTVGGGVGLAAAADYCLATKWASIRLSELAVGIGPFVIGPAVERKIGFSNFSKMALTPDEWQTAAWAKDNGLFHECFDTKDFLDDYLERLLEKLSAYNPAALRKLKKVFWENTNNWDQLLEQRAEISGKLVLSQASKEAINAFLQA